MTSSPTKLVTFITGTHEVDLWVEAAWLPTKGLANRVSLAENSGMLFTFHKENFWAFWMKGTYLPLDIIFVDDSFTVVDIKQGEPLSLVQIVPDVPCRYVIETNKGWVASNGVVKGETKVIL